ncbi:S-layer homology domain-containing protein [Pseudarthrobacter sp. L19]|uniref:S-layer homology domain-containing protein n=1 Tax=Pseudarthrobacter sp. L19 TaxID=3423951 RepID=UPI003D7A5C7F
MSLAALTVAPPAMAAGTASISGVVTVPAGADPTNVLVQAVVPPGSPLTGPTPEAKVDSSGKYILSGLEAGSYKLHFTYCSECSMLNYGVKSGPEVAAIWSGNGDSFDQGTLTTVTAGQTVTDVSVNMNLGATISGKISFPADVDPTTISVNATTTTTYYNSYGSTRLLKDGTYSIPALPSGQYRISYTSFAAKPDIVRGFYGGQTESSATTVDVPRLGKVTGINMTARAAGFITGTVSVPTGMSPAEVTVSVFAAGGDYRNSLVNAWPKDDGTFSIDGLAAGSYKLQFNGSWLNIPTLWLGADSAEASQTVAVTEGHTTSGINQAMERGSTISGKVSLPKGTAPVVAGGASLLRADGSIVNIKPLDASGGFSFAGLHSGSYTVEFNRTSGYTTNLEAQFFKDVPESAGAAAATKVTVAAGETKSDLTASAQLGGTLTGTLVDAGGKPMAARIRAYTTDGSLVTRGTSSAPDGTFKITGLTTGEYSLTALDVQNGQLVEAPAIKVKTTVGQNTDVGMLNFGGAPTPTPTPTAPVFKDVAPGAQFSSEISWLASRGISTGWDEGNGNTSYRPLTPVNRDAMAAFMYRLANKPAFTAPPVSPFEDMTTSTQFYKEVTWLADRKISTGWTNGTVSSYRPVSSVNRDAMAAFLYRLAGKPDFTPPATSPFTDVATDNQFYKEITWLAAQKISTGWDEGNGKATYRPLQSVNRDAMAAFMFRWNSKYGN